jgi:hypothetical protein
MSSNCLIYWAIKRESNPLAKGGDATTIVYIGADYPHPCEAAMLDLRELVCAFLAVVGAVSLFGGYRLFANARGGNVAAAAFFAGFGAVLIVLVAMMTLGPWRVRQESVFPIRVLDLNIPPAAIEKVGPPNPPPAPPAPEPASRRQAVTP